MPGRNLIEPGRFFPVPRRSSKSQFRIVLVVCHPGDNAFHERTREINGVAAELAFVGREQGLFCSSDVALKQRAIQPESGDLRHCTRICRSDFIDQLMQRPGISFLLHFYLRAPAFILRSFGSIAKMRSIVDFCSA